MPAPVRVCLRRVGEMQSHSKETSGETRPGQVTDKRVRTASVGCQHGYSLLGHIETPDVERALRALNVPARGVLEEVGSRAREVAVAAATAHNGGRGSPCTSIC